MKRFLIPFFLAAASFSAVAQEFPDIYLRGAYNNWAAEQAYKLSREGNVYSIHLDQLDGNFKLASSDWNSVDLGGSTEIGNQGVYPLFWGEGNLIAKNLTDVTLSFTYEPTHYERGQHVTNLYVSLEHDPNPNPFPDPGPHPDPNPTPDPVVEGLSGTLPVLYINVYTDSSKTQFNNEIISKDLNHKNYFEFAEYRLDVNGCQWLIDLGAQDLGSADNMLPLQIKARGNWTRRGFSKKPFKLKLDKKASMLGMTKSKHYAILAHADDDTGYLKNFTGFNLGKRMNLPWTPGMQPIEVVINGDYRGLYFLTESIRVGDDRVMITELDDNEQDASLASGGYLVELDNYDEENQIRMREKTCTYVPNVDMLRVTFDTPEEYSEVQKRFVTDQFSAMNDAVGSNSDDLWRLMDLDDAARYYIVEEIISHYEAYHGSTYLFRDFGEGQKWHFTPLWDCGNAFRAPTNDFFYNHGPFGNTWIPSMRCNNTFNNKVEDSWKWFMSNRFDGIYEDIDLFASRVQAAAEADYKRWHNVAPPDGGQEVADNRNMTEKAEFVKNHLRQKIQWLKNQFGDFTAQTFAEPERDNTTAQPLPDYVKPADPPTPIDPTPDDPTTMPEVFLRGDVNGWNASSEYKMTYENETYTIHVNELNGKFKFASADWNTIDFGAGAMNAITHSSTFPLVEDGSDFIANNLRDVTLSFPYIPGMRETTLTVVVNGEVDPIPDPTPGNNGISGSLPVLYINVYTDSSKTQFNDEIISKDLNHKNYFEFAEYRLDVNGCQWLIDLGAQDLGSADNMLPLQIKARGNWTRRGFSKKPFKLKLDKKASMLGMTKSKHYAILAHADDETGYLKNFTGFNLGKRMGLPWTPGMQPIEVVINGDYRGLYFLTESIRVGDDRVMITELNDNEEDASLASGGYLVELDNYDEDNQIRMTEKGCVNTWTRDMLRITFDTPEEYSDVQKRFIRDQFSAMNDAIGSNSDDLWKLMDLDDAARYYLVEEIISHYEAYHGSTYLFRDFGEGQKWHFSPLWDCGNAFRAPTDNYFYNVPGLGFGNTWIPSMRANDTFNNKVEDSWKWFMSNRFDGIYEDIDLFASRVQAAAEADYKRWHNVAPPDGGQGVADNRNMTEKAEFVKNHLRQKIEWLKNRFGDFTAQTFPEPERDNTEAMPLPDYVKPAEPPTPIDPIPNVRPDIYLRAESNGWNVGNEYKFSVDENDIYTLHLDRLDGKFKIGSDDWKSFDFGASGLFEVVHSSSFPMVNAGSEFIARNLYDVTLSFAYTEGMTETTLNVVSIDPVPTDNGVSGSLPVLYINVYTDETKSQYDNEIINKDLDHKNYFTFAEYRLDVNGCEWLIDLGAENLGSADEMLPLQIKARGNWTRRGFSKKPFKLKLDKKASMLGMTNSKHYALLAHADDDTGYLKNFTGFNLGKRIGLPWTPGMQPVEVVINGDYRGLYFLTESIRVEDERVNITELADNETDGKLASGGYLVELDNYDEENQIRMQEKVCTFVPIVDYLRVTFNTPEEYSDIQKRFIEEQFSAMNDAVGNNSDALWSLMDLDDAARYYLVEEIISHYEAYHGSTYLFRDFGEDQKWHFSPLWDCGNAFRAPTNCFFYEYGVYGNTWIPSISCNDMFNKKVKETWLWFMSNNFEGLFDDIDTYAERLKEAAAADYNRWHDQPTPNGGQAVADNRNMTEKAEFVKNHLTDKINWLRRKFGNYATAVFPEPERDNTPAMPLPEYVLPEESRVKPEISDDDSSPARYYNLQGIEVKNPDKGVYIKVKGTKASKVAK